MAQDLLSRDIRAVDLRQQNRPTLQLAPHALTEMRRLRGIIPVENAL
jgi:cell division protein FtsQ